MIMSMEQIANLVTRLGDRRNEYYGVLARAQNDLRRYVVNRQYPLDDRFEVWADWCEKDEHGSIIYEVDMPLFGKIVEDPEFSPNFYRHKVYDWLYFLELFDDTNEGADTRKRYSVTSDDVRELLIKHNFGSFTMDW